MLYVADLRDGHQELEILSEKPPNVYGNILLKYEPWNGHLSLDIIDQLKDLIELCTLSPTLCHKLDSSLSRQEDLK